MAEYLNHVKFLNDSLAAVGNHVAETDLVLFTLNGLSSDYEAFITSVTTAKNLPSFSEIYALVCSLLLLMSKLKPIPLFLWLNEDVGEAGLVAMLTIQEATDGIVVVAAVELTQCKESPVNIVFWVTEQHREREQRVSQASRREGAPEHGSREFHHRRSRRERPESSLTPSPSVRERIRETHVDPFGYAPGVHPHLVDTGAGPNWTHQGIIDLMCHQRLDYMIKEEHDRFIEF
ncbi:hypothetical protein EJ110_NYTH57556 [Nymphaea thermarum]|nr:hypothetical protein EJ110_NYTH57556 [Nymphaea thermarum]